MSKKTFICETNSKSELLSGVNSIKSLRPKLYQNCNLGKSNFVVFTPGVDFIKINSYVLSQFTL